MVAVIEGVRVEAERRRGSKGRHNRGPLGAGRVGRGGITALLAAGHG
jgi:hypothetical protein